MATYNNVDCAGAKLVLEKVGDDFISIRLERGSAQQVIAILHGFSELEIIDPPTTKHEFVKEG